MLSTQTAAAPFSPPPPCDHYFSSGSHFFSQASAISHLRILTLCKFQRCKLTMQSQRNLLLSLSSMILHLPLGSELRTTAYESQRIALKPTNNNRDFWWPTPANAAAPLPVVVVQSGEEETTSTLAETRMRLLSVLLLRSKEKKFDQMAI